MHVPLCLCATWPTIETASRITLVMQVREWAQPSNTGRVAWRTMPRCALTIYGRWPGRSPIEGPEGVVPDFDEEAHLRDPEVQTLLLHPAPDAPALSDVPRDGRPVHLLVPDGTWRQTSRIARRIGADPTVQRVSLPEPKSRSGGVLRQPPTDTHLGTGEAIASALQALGEHDAATELRRAVRVMVDRALFVRGKIAHTQVLGGISLDIRRELSGFVAD